MELFEFKDIKSTQDPIHTYTEILRTSETPLIIDNGSYQCRVGWMTEEKPTLKFKSVIAKPRKERSKKEGEPAVTPQTQVGNDIINLEAVRFQLKTQFDRNVVTHFEAQEHIFDYMFTHLGIDNEGAVPHPIVLTEAFLNPNYSRQLMSELLFECYGIPSLAYGVDGLLGYFYGQKQVAENALLITLGYHNVHIIPILDGQVIWKHSRRINTGGQHMITFLHRLLQLKYPSHSAAITLGRAEELLHTYCQIAYDYGHELEKWSSPDYYQENIIRIQLPYNTASLTSGLTVEQQKERKKELARRLMEMNARKREERLAEDEDKLNQLLSVSDLYDEVDEEEFMQSLSSHGLKSYDDLQKNIGSLHVRIERTKQKIAAASNVTDDMPDEKPKPSKADKFEPGPQEDLQSWLTGVKRKRQELLTRRAARKQRRNDMAKRRTAAAQERMRLISQLARKEKGNDDFGMRDEDWDVYKTISREAGDSDSELETEKLVELEEILRQHDPHPENSSGAENAEAHQLHIGVERFRAPEIIFQPSMVGSIEAGLSETIGYVISQFTVQQQNDLVNNVVLMGGCASLPGIKQRLTRELTEIRPYESHMDVAIIDDPILCSWTGARSWAKNNDLKKYLISRDEYNEYGSDFFKPFVGSNLFFPSPKVQGAVVDIDL